jgi:hypothetical protein
MGGYFIRVCYGSLQPLISGSVHDAFVCGAWLGV